MSIERFQSSWGQEQEAHLSELSIDAEKERLRLGFDPSELITEEEKLHMEELIKANCASEDKTGAPEIAVLQASNYQHLMGVEKMSDLVNFDTKLAVRRQYEQKAPESNTSKWQYERCYILRYLKWLDPSLLHGNLPPLSSWNYRIDDPLKNVVLRSNMHVNDKVHEGLEGKQMEEWEWGQMDNAVIASIHKNDGWSFVHILSNLRLIDPEKFERELSLTREDWKFVKEYYLSLKKNKDYSHLIYAGLPIKILAAEKAYIDPNGMLQIEMHPKTESAEPMLPGRRKFE